MKVKLLEKSYTLDFLDILKLMFVSMALGCGLTLLNSFLGFIIIGFLVLYILVEFLFKLGVLGDIQKK